MFRKKCIRCKKMGWFWQFGWKKESKPNPFLSDRIVTLMYCPECSGTDWTDRPSIFKPNVEKLKAKRNIRGLIKAANYRKNRTIRKNAVMTLAELGNSLAVDPLTISLKKDPDPRVRISAAEALSRLGGPRAVEPLVAALQDSDWNVRQVAWDELSKIDPSRAKSEKVSKLCGTLHDRLPGIGFCYGFQERAAAAKQLGHLGGARATEALIAALATSTSAGHWEVNKSAAEALGEIGDPRAIKPLMLAIKESGVTTSLRDAARMALDRINPNWAKSKEARKAVPQLLTTLKGDDWPLWTATAETLGQIGDLRAVESLISMLRNSDTWAVFEDTRKELRKVMAAALMEITGEKECGEDANKWLARWKRIKQTGIDRSTRIDNKKLIASFEESLNQYIKACEVSEELAKALDKPYNSIDMERRLRKAHKTVKQAERVCVKAAKNLRDCDDSSLALEVLEKALLNSHVQCEGHVLSAVQETIEYIKS